MRPDRDPQRAGSLLLLPLLAALAACGAEPQQDPDNREVYWKYGPTTTAARAEHLAATGKAKDSSGPIAKGWKFRLVDGRTLTVQPFELASSHDCFGKVKMLVNLYDRSEQRIGLVESPVITAEEASFSFELSADHAEKLEDIVIWFGPA